MLRNKLYKYGDETVKVPAHLHFGKDMLDRMMVYGDHLAVIYADNNVTLTFGQLAQQTVDIALSLARIGVRKGDVVSVCSEQKMKTLPTVLGAICLGAVYTPAEISYGSVPLQHRIEISRPKIMFMSPTTFSQHKQIFDKVGCIEKYIIYEDEIQNGGGNQHGGTEKDSVIYFKDFLTETCDVADFVPTPVDGTKDWSFILYSSGTTGLPKGVPLTHLGAIMNSISRTNESLEKSSILMTPKWYLSFGINITINCLWRGITCVFTDIEREHDYLTAIQKHKVKLLFLVPCLINDLIKSAIVDQYDVTSVEGILTTSSPLAREQVDAIKKNLMASSMDGRSNLEEWNHLVLYVAGYTSVSQKHIKGLRFPTLREVYQFYGITETGAVCSNLYAPLGPRDGSVGVPVHGYIIKIVDLETREPLGANQRGEICLKSPTVTPGFIGVDNSPFFDPEGFYKTGDVGYYDTDGYFYVVNRIKDLIKYDDLSIAPAEMESLLDLLEQVKESGVSSVDGAPAAAVVLQPGATISAAEVADYLHSMVTFFRLTGGVHFVEKLPRGAGNKLNRKELQTMLEVVIKKN